jgi:hypothetical protein
MTVLVAAAIVVVFFVPLPHTSLFHNLVAPAKVAAPTKLPVVDLSATPKGWVPVAYGDAQVSVPATWNVLFNLCDSGSSVGDVYLNPGGGFCHAQGRPKGKTTITLLPVTDGEFQGSPSSQGQRSVINGISVYALYNYGHGPYVGTDYLVPSLGVEIATEGPLARRVVDTLTRSPRAVAIASGPAPAVPSSWRKLSFQGLAFAAPAEWPVEHTSTYYWFISQTMCPGVGSKHVTPLVVLSTDKSSAFCLRTASSPPVPRDGLEISSEPRKPTVKALAPVFSTRCFYMNDLRVCPATSPAYSILVLKVTVPGRSKPVIVSIGLAGNGTTARTILYSLRAT